VGTPDGGGGSAQRESTAFAAFFEDQLRQTNLAG
jgi:hypothetical protein